jgi:serine/threonine protein kinase
MTGAPGACRARDKPIQSIEMTKPGLSSAVPSQPVEQTPAAQGVLSGEVIAGNYRVIASSRHRPGWHGGGRGRDAATLESGTPFILMEYLEGHDLETLIQRDGRLGLRESVDYLLQASEAIAEAHRNGIVHRDLEPANLHVSERLLAILTIRRRC